MDGTALAMGDDAETFGAGQTGIGEGALPIPALAADRVVLHGACDRRGGGARLLHHDGAGRNDAGDEYKERCGVRKNTTDHHNLPSDFNSTIACGC
jgi:hypothetical protein